MSGRRTAAGEAGPPVIALAIAAALFAMAALMLSQGLALFGDQLPVQIPPVFWGSGHLGVAHAYTLLATVLLLLCRIFFTDPFSFKEISSGIWSFAAECGKNLNGILFRKHLSMFLPTLFVYCLGAGLAFAGGWFLIPDKGDLKMALACYLMGLMALILVLASESIVGALGLEDSILGILVFSFSGLVIAVWHRSGFLNALDAVSVQRGIRTFVDPAFPVFPVIVVMAYLLALLICMTVPKSRISRYEIEQMDETVFDELEIPEGIEILEKNGEKLSLVFTKKTK